MHTRTKLVLTALAAVVVLSALVGTASANRLSISNRFLRILHTSVTFSDSQSGGGSEAICPVTMEGSFHSNTIPKIRELLIGYISKAELNEASCRFAGAFEGITMDTAALPWHIRYEGFTGTLPRITGVLDRTVNLGFRARALGLACVYRSTAASPARTRVVVNTATGAADPLQALPETSIPRFEGSMFCPASGFFIAEGRTRLLNNLLQLIFLRLI